MTQVALKKPSLLSTLSADIPAAIVVALVALPLCLGVALASGALLFSGIISGIVGGIVVGALSKSSFSVSGPAAGLTVIVLGAIESLPSFEAFLTALALAGFIQVIFGLLRAGSIADFIPSAVIRGMLAAIGITIILEQIPYALGHATQLSMGHTLLQSSHFTSLSHLWEALHHIHNGAVAIAMVSLFIMLGWEHFQRKSQKAWARLVPSPLLVIMAAIGLNYFFHQSYPALALSNDHLVSIPITATAWELMGELRHPDWGMLAHMEIWRLAFTLALVSSIATLLGIEAIDRLDPSRRVTPTNRELMAQGAGNIVSGLIGGLPITSVIVRSSVNIEAGAKTKISVILHGVLLALSVIFLAEWLNHIPLAALASVLLVTGYKLVRPRLFMAKYRKGYDHFIPFITTILAILLTDLLVGIGIGFAVGATLIVLRNYRSPLMLVQHGEHYLLRARKELFFIHKYELRQKLGRIPDGTHALIDLSRIFHVDLDNIDVIEEFIMGAPLRQIGVRLKINPEGRTQARLKPYI